MKKTEKKVIRLDDRIKTVTQINKKIAFTDMKIISKSKFMSSAKKV